MSKLSRKEFCRKCMKKNDFKKLRNISSTHTMDIISSTKYDDISSMLRYHSNDCWFCQKKCEEYVSICKDCEKDIKKSKKKRSV